MRLQQLRFHAPLPVLNPRPVDGIRRIFFLLGPVFASIEDIIGRVMNELGT